MVSLTRSVVSSLCAAALFALSCNSAHTEDSTETGNPPFLDVDKIALVISAGSVRIVGQPGAVKPGGASVEVVNVGTGEVMRGTAAADGSFDIPIMATQEAVIEVSASDGNERSGSVYVTRGGAMVGSGEDDALSCMQRSNLASQAIGSVLSSADTSCRTAADCKEVPYNTSCTDTCDDAIVATGAEAGIRAAVDAIDQGLCSGFAADGCKIIALPCVPPPTGPIACIDGRCQQQEKQNATPAACPSCLNRTVSWGLTNNAVRYSVSDCNMFTRAPTGQTACGSQLPHCDPGRRDLTVEELIDALGHPDVETALATGGTVGGAPVPGGFSTSVEVDDRSFVITFCGTNLNCPDIPPGVQALKAVLDRLANGIECTPSTCPLDQVLVTDVCTECGPNGGCGKTETKCVATCSISSDCPQPPGGGGLGCSERKICEAIGCI